MALNKNPKVDLKLKYQRVFEVCVILSLAVLIVAFKYFPTFEQKEIKVEAPQELVDVEDVEATKQEAAPPPPPKPPIPIEAPSDDVLEDIEIADTELDVDEEVTAPPPPPPPAKGDEVEEEEPAFFVAVEEMPSPIGGIAAIQQKIVYPEIAKRAGVQGRVFVKAFVDEQGNVKKVELIKGIGAGCDEAAIKAVQETKFKPGKQRGKPVKVQVTVPVLFKLQ
ncbi:MAG: energy transducer TonB [Ignavibacteria bacterium]